MRWFSCFLAAVAAVVSPDQQQQRRSVNHFIRCSLLPRLHVEGDNTLQWLENHNAHFYFSLSAAFLIRSNKSFITKEIISFFSFSLNCLSYGNVSVVPLLISIE